MDHGIDLFHRSGKLYIHSLDPQAMANADEELIEKFYTAFQRKDFRTMQSLYHDKATFSDPVFQNLNAAQVRAMWEMLLTSSSDLKVVFDQIRSSPQETHCHWEAWYTFTSTKRPVHNRIDAVFKIVDGKILSHRDSFNLWRWSRQALGTVGLVMGWSPLIRNKIRKTARQRLNRFMAS
jgi:limonene-1,2-epoxide hydrolase